ncbi:nonribosomal peptide synthase [Stemphylium lycopersici]|uniref:Nonribosomal peptide synthase n=1 Tax=Stemphylium lycopersici TaxID=183478 RepID=A0A364N656_STELY|nr:nonribosomal peptide synthase [Stemphylium lycopersici]
MPLGEIHDLPIALPQLNGAHTGEAIATAVVATLRAYGITSDTLGYFVLNNASNNDTTIAAVAREFGDFNPTQRRLRCGPHTINLIGQALLFGNNKDVYDNAAEHIDDEEAFIAAWRKHGALELWRSYKKAPPTPPPQPARTGAIDDVIEALTARRNCARRDGGDEYDRWLEEEPSWTSSCECERLFSELGDLLEPKRRAISSKLLAALQLIRSWTRAGYTYNAKRGDDDSGDELARKYSIQN